MIHDTSRLKSDISTVVSTLAPEVDLAMLVGRMGEVLVNYDINRKSEDIVARDLLENVNLFLSAKRLEGMSETTLKDYEIELKLFCKSVDITTAHISTVDIRSYLSSNKNIMLSTVSKKTSVLKSFFGWLTKEEIILRNPTSKIKLPKKSKHIPKGLSIEELELVRESCLTKRQRAFIEIFYSTGCRLSEIASMNIEDIDYQSMSMSVVGKGDKERVVYLSFKALYHLRSYLNSRQDDCEALFITERRPFRRLGNAAIQREIGKIKKQSELKKDLTPHTMRHTLATIMLDNGADIADVQQILGHEDPATTLIYAQVSEARKRHAFKKYHVQ